jgi:hypothetical protein
MQDLTAVAQNLGQIAAAFKDGGLYFLIGVGLFLLYLVSMAAIKRHRKATQEINLNLGAPAGQDSSAKVCPLHSGVDAQIKSLESFRQENREDHGKIFTQLSALSSELAKK